MCRLPVPRLNRAWWYDGSASTSARRPRSSPRNPRISFARRACPDGAVIHRLVADCPPLDLNTVYAYLLLCEHFPAVPAWWRKAPAAVSTVSSRPMCRPGRAGPPVRLAGRGARARPRPAPGAPHVARAAAPAGNWRTSAIWKPPSAPTTTPRAAPSPAWPPTSVPMWPNSLSSASSCSASRGHDDELLLRIGPFASIPR